MGILAFLAFLIALILLIVNVHLTWVIWLAVIGGLILSVSGGFSFSLPWKR